MDSHMITNNPGNGPLAERFFEYAIAYLEAAIVLNDHAVHLGKKCTWPFSTAVMFNTVHSVELFLKAMILKAKPEKTEAKETHSIEKLARSFRSAYPNEKWRIPFERASTPVAANKELLKVFGLTKKPKETAEEREQREQLIEQLDEQINNAWPFSIENRYPVDTKGHEWKTLQGHVPGIFAAELRHMKAEYKRIWSQ